MFYPTASCAFVFLRAAGLSRSRRDAAAAATRVACARFATVRSTPVCTTLASLIQYSTVAHPSAPRRARAFVGASPRAGQPPACSLPCAAVRARLEALQWRTTRRQRGSPHTHRTRTPRARPTRRRRGGANATSARGATAAWAPPIRASTTRATSRTAFATPQSASRPRRPRRRPRRGASRQNGSTRSSATSTAGGPRGKGSRRRRRRTRGVIGDPATSAH